MHFCFVIWSMLQFLWGGGYGVCKKSWFGEIVLGREDENCGVEAGFLFSRTSTMQAFNRLQQLDQYPKINEDFYSWTLQGGVIAIVSSILMALLFSAGKT